MPPALIVCPSCACHAKSTETECPSCGEPLRRKDGTVPRAAVAVLLGLTAAGAAGGACSSTGPGGGAGGSGTGTGGTGTVMAHYGIAMTVSSSSSGVAAAYGIATTSSSGGEDAGSGD
jgi:hypothetical protein